MMFFASSTFYATEYVSKDRHIRVVVVILLPLSICRLTSDTEYDSKLLAVDHDGRRNPSLAPYKLIDIDT